MGKTLNGERIARDERDGFVFPVGSRLSPFAQAWLALRASGDAPLRREPGRRIGCVVLGLSFLLLLMGCAANDSASDDNRRGGFYGSVSGGMSHP